MEAFVGSTLLIKFSEKLGVSVLLRILAKIDPRLVLARTQYRKRLVEKLKEMPFLFKDMNLSARDDYVALDVLTISKGNAVRNTSALPDFSGPLPKFKAHPRALIFGDGGYGKTTLFRNLALRALEKKPWEKMFGKRGVLPVYLPLKVVKTSSDFPIIEAIQSLDPYFMGARGLRRLMRLGNSGRLVLLLDGYDEMPYTGGFDHAKREIEFILANRFSHRNRNQSAAENAFNTSQFASTYYALRQSRVYLASRFEFYEYSPIVASPDVQEWVVKGLEDRRIQLVERIFSRYRLKSQASSGSDLNAELFLQELARTGDKSVNDLSKSPLFLTVMCYVYAKNFGSGGPNVFSLGASELSKTCVRLLLEDLDKYKSRDASQSDRKAILNRRAAYPEEKYSFLSYFAVKLYECERSFFDEAFVIERAKTFFSLEFEGSSTSEIIRGLSSDEATSNIVMQIIFSGIFVLVDKRDGIRYLDFPHRKFREALAVDYFSDIDRIERLVASVSKKPYAELVLAFIEQSNRRQPVVDRLVELVAEAATPHVAVLFVDVLKRLSSDEAERAVMKLLDASDGKSTLQLPVGVLSYLPKGSSHWRYFREKLTSSISGRTGLLAHRWALVSAKVDISLATSVAEDLATANCDFMTLRYLVHSPLVTEASSPIVNCYVVSGFREGNGNLVLADLIQIFYAGKSVEAKREFKTWLRFVIGDSSEDGADRVRKFCGARGDEDVERLLDAARELRPAFVA